MNPSRYYGIGQKLQETTADEITLKFNEIEELNHWPLPPSAKKHQSWWGNDSQHVQAKDGWLAVGWKVKSVDIRNEVVLFKKVEEKQVPPSSNKSTNQPHDHFELIARECLQKFFNDEPLWPRKNKDVDVFFDLISKDGSIVGEVKYLSKTKTGYIPTTALDSITSSVWLIEKVNATTKFIAFGGDREIPEKWLDRYGKYTKVIFYYIYKDNEKVVPLN